MTRGYRTLEFGDTFLETFAEFPRSDRRRLQKALRPLDDDERHPSLRIHKLEGDQRGAWSASASDELRLTFVRLEGGRKALLTCSRHYR